MRLFTALLVGLLLAGDAAAQTVRTLVLDQGQEQTLRAGETQSYTLTLQPGWFVSGRVDQQGVDVTVTVTGPDDRQVARFDTPTGAWGAEHFRFTSEAAGVYRIQVAPADTTHGGRYAIRLRRQEPVATTPEGRVEQATSMFDLDTPGVVIAVIRGGRIAFQRALGQADLTHGVPFTVETVTNLGSTSKQFTGFALALLADRGALSLDDDVRRHIPELPDFGTKVTLRHLLSHTTGYREFINTLALGGRQVMAGDYVGNDELIQVVQRQPRLQNEPGAEFNYNNTAFGLATTVVERVTGKPFPQWMEEEVFRPLGMNHTVVRSHPGQVIPNRSVGYVPAEGGFREVRDLGGSMGAGGVYTTVADLARWMRNLHTAELGGPRVVRELTTRNVLTGGDTTSYGLGLFIDSNRGLRRMHHGGSDVAHRSTFVYYPELDAGYVVQSNHGALPGSVASLVAEAFFGEHMTAETPRAAAATPPAAPGLVPAARLESYVGRYALDAMPSVVLTISRDDAGRPLLQVTGQPAVAMTAASDTTFALPIPDVSVTFHRAADGRVNALTLHQSGNHRASRVPDAAPVDLAPLAGRYFSEELETFYDLAVEDGSLVVRHRRFGEVTLVHAAADRFTSGTFPITNLEFERNGSGRVTGFRVGNGRARDILFERRN
jgi:CubicO group peptidase (beta-lactamase class C family)